MLRLLSLAALASQARAGTEAMVCIDELDAIGIMRCAAFSSTTNRYVAPYSDWNMAFLSDLPTFLPH